MYHRFRIILIGVILLCSTLSIWALSNNLPHGNIGHDRENSGQRCHLYADETGCGNIFKRGFDKVKNKVKKVKEKVEVTAGWDRYIYAWGDRKIPDTRRWVAIRTIYKKNSKDMGNFWDVPGDGNAVRGPEKKLQLWEMPYKFQRYPQLDRRYKFIPLWEMTSNKDDQGYYLIKSGTGYYVYNDRFQLKLNRSSNFRTDRSYHWEIINKGTNRFNMVSRANGKYITASGIAKNNGTPLKGRAYGTSNSLWEFIIIANGNEKKSTASMAKKRAREVSSMARSEVKRLKEIARKKGIKFNIGITSVVTKKLKDLIGRINSGPSFENAPYMKNDKEASDIPPSITRNAGMRAFNWKSRLTPVKNQTGCGSCWAFTATAIYEGVYKLVSGKELDLSEQYIVDCARDSKGDAGSCNGGRSERVFESLKTISHIQEKKVPYEAKNKRCYGTWENPYRVRKWGWVSPKRKTATVEEIKEAVCKYGPISTSVQVTDVWKGYKGGIIDMRVNTDQTNHAVVIVGWDDSKSSWLVRNSWGSDWGQSGYCWIKYGASNIGNWSAWMRVSRDSNKVTRK